MMSQKKKEIKIAGPPEFVMYPRLKVIENEIGVEV